jgi:CheY-like chemotaxis protein
MDGRMVSERVKARPETRNTRILGISGFIDADEAAELEDFGFDDFLQKPFSIETLNTKVVELFARPTVRGIRTPR